MTDAFEPYDLEVNSVGMVTSVGFGGEFPRSSGNCFDLGSGSFDSEDAKYYRILNFGHENFEELMKREVLTWPVKIKVIDEDCRRAVMHDPRIPDEWYDSLFCTVCTPTHLLPWPQRLRHLRREEQGWRTVHPPRDGQDFGFVSEKMPPGHRASFLWPGEETEDQRFYTVKLRYYDESEQHYWTSYAPDRWEAVVKNHGDMDSLKTEHEGTWMVEKDHYVVEANDWMGAIRLAEEQIGGHDKSIDGSWPTLLPGYPKKD